MTDAERQPLGGPRLVVALGSMMAATGVAVLSSQPASLYQGAWSAAGVCFLVFAFTRGSNRLVVGAVLATVLAVGMLLAQVAPGRAIYSAIMLSVLTALLAIAFDAVGLRWITELRDLAIYVSFAVAAAMIFCGASSTYRLIAGHHLGSGILPDLVNALASLLLVGPLGLAEHRRGLRVSIPEVVFQSLLLSAAMVSAYALAALNIFQLLPLPLLMWACFRFGERILAMQLALVYVGAMILATTFTLPTGEPQWYVDVFLIVVFFVAMPSAIAGRERYDAMRALRMSERTFRNNYRRSQVPAALVEWVDGELQFIDVNSAGSRLFHRSSRALANSPVVQTLVLPDDFDAIISEIESGERHGWEGRAQVQGPENTELLLTVSLLETRSGRARLSFTMHDMTSEYRVREQLTSERNYNLAVLDSSPCIILVTTDDGVIINANPTGCETVGYSEEELVGRHYYDILTPPEFRDEVMTTFGGDGFETNGETVVLTKSGRRRVTVWNQASFSSNLHDKPLRVFTAIDVTEQREQSQFLKQLVNSASTVAFIGTDLDGKVTMFNSGAETLLGYTRAKATGMDFTSFISPAALAAHAESAKEGTFADMVAHVAAERIPETRDWTWVRASGVSLRVSMTTSVVTDYAGRPFGYLFVARDVSDTRRSQEIVVLALKRERDAVNRLRALDRVKDDFISTVSHELRTPMTSILGTTEMLEDGIVGDLTSAQRERLGVISRNGERLLGLADDLLMAAKLQNGTEQPLEESLDLRPIIQESFDSLGPQLGGRDLDVQVNLPDAPVVVTGSSHHLERAVTNLLSNAIKFTPDGGQVRCSLDIDSSGTNAVVTVSDTGMGIPNEALNSVVERFYRAPNVDELAIQGTGLGLSIVKQIVDNLHGQLTISSTVGGGTTVTMSLPLTSRRVPTQTSRT